MSREVRHVQIKVTSNADKTLTKGTAAATGLGGALKGVAASAGAATGGIRAMTTALISSGVGAFVVLLGSVVAGLRTVISTSSDFEFQMDKLQAVTESTTEQMVIFKKEAIRLGSSTEYTATQVSQLQTEFAKLGFTTQEIINATDATLDLATAAGVDLAEAARVTGSTLAAFGLDTVETQRLIDVMAKSFSSSALDMSKFSGGITQAAAAANAMDVSVEQTVGAMSLLNNAGIEGSKVGTDLRKIFGEISKTTGKDFRGSLDVLAESMDKVNSKQEKMDILTEAVGERSKIALSILIDQREKLDDLTHSYENAEGAVSDMAAIMRDNAKTGAQLAKSAWEGLILSIEDGDGIIQDTVDGAWSLLTGALEKLTDMVNWFGTVGTAKLKNMATDFANAFISIRIKTLEALDAMDRFLGRDVNLERSKEIAGLYTEAADNSIKMQTRLNDAWAKLAEKQKAAEKTAAGNRVATAAASEETITQDEKDELEERRKNREAFLNKLKTLEEDFEDKTELEKLERKRQRHLAELEQLEIDETQKGEIRARINGYYDDLIANKREQLMLNEYMKDADKAIKAGEDKKKLAQELADKEREIKMQILDDTAEIFGQETAMYKAMHALKAALKIKEILLEAGLIKTKAIADQAETVGEAGKGSAKALASGNPFKIAAALAGVAAVVATSLRSMKKTTGAADKMAAIAGGSAGGAGSPSAPQFNVIGATSAGENLIAEQVANANSKPVKAYVVDSEVTSTQDLSRRAENIASF